jgi:hypothetical protein
MSKKDKARKPAKVGHFKPDRAGYLILAGSDGTPAKVAKVITMALSTGEYTYGAKVPYSEVQRVLVFANEETAPLLHREIEGSGKLPNAEVRIVTGIALTMKMGGTNVGQTNALLAVFQPKAPDFPKLYGVHDVKGCTPEEVFTGGHAAVIDGARRHVAEYRPQMVVIAMDDVLDIRSQEEELMFLSDDYLTVVAVHEDMLTGITAEAA